MSNKSFIVGLLGLVMLGFTNLASAQVADRCRRDDQLSQDQAIGRNAWAVANGYISQVFADALKSIPPYGMYVVFSRACATYPSPPAGSDCIQYAPISPAEPKNSTFTLLGTCFAGCLTPTQKVVFNGREIEIAAAAAAKVPTVTALIPGSSPSAMRFREQPIRTFVAGDTQEDVLHIETAEGHRVEVTTEHPMVNERGEVIMAVHLQVGSKLLRSDGSIETIKKIQAVPYAGKVWNIQPLSEQKADNILTAEGFLTGSVRFQNEWSRDAYRLLLRDHLSTGGF